MRAYIGPVLYLSGKTIQVPNSPFACCGTPGCQFQNTLINLDTGRKFCSRCGAEYKFNATHRERKATFVDFMFDENNPASRKHIDRLRYPNEADFLIPNLSSDEALVAIVNPAAYSEDNPGIPFPVWIDEDVAIDRFRNHYRELLSDLKDYGFKLDFKLLIVLD